MPIVLVVSQENIRWLVGGKTKQHAYPVVLENIQPALPPTTQACALPARLEATRVQKEQAVSFFA